MAVSDRIAVLDVQHRHLDQAICQVQRHITCDSLAVTKLKKKKLRIKDELAQAKRLAS